MSPRTDISDIVFRCSLFLFDNSFCFLLDLSHDMQRKGKSRSRCTFRARSSSWTSFCVTAIFAFAMLQIFYWPQHLHEMPSFIHESRTLEHNRLRVIGCTSAFGSAEILPITTVCHKELCDMAIQFIVLLLVPFQNYSLIAAFSGTTLPQQLFGSLQSTWWAYHLLADSRRPISVMTHFQWYPMSRL